MKLDERRRPRLLVRGLQARPRRQGPLRPVDRHDDALRHRPGGCRQRRRGSRGGILRIATTRLPARQMRTMEVTGAGNPARSVSAAQATFRPLLRRLDGRRLRRRLLRARRPLDPDAPPRKKRELRAARSDGRAPPHRRRRQILLTHYEGERRAGAARARARHVEQSLQPRHGRHESRRVSRREPDYDVWRSTGAGASDLPAIRLEH